MVPTRHLAVSYSRFSDPKQADGDSADRQERDYRSFCERHNLTPGKEVFADRGRSGFKDEHRKKGRLGQLIQAAKDNLFEPGTVVVIEAWDRLGRLRPDKQTELVAELLKTGVSIGVCKLNDIFTEEDFGTHKWTMLAVFIQLAHQESKQKAERVAASWESRRQKAREDGTLVGSSLPAWIGLKNNKPHLIPERAEAVRRIFTLAAEGLGHTLIVKRLHNDHVAAFGPKVVRKDRQRSQFSGVWTKPYVALLLNDRRVLGEMQLMKAGKPDGAPLVGYYPAAVTEDDFNLARAAQEQRLQYDSAGRKSGPRQGKYVNLFKGMLTHTRDGEGFLLHNKGSRTKPELILINARGNGGRAARSYTFPYPIFEEAVLRLLKEIDPETVLPTHAVAPLQATVLRAKLGNLRQDIASLKTDLAAGYSKALADVLRVAEVNEEKTANDLQDELLRTAKPLARTWGEVPTLIDLIRGADDPDAVRLKLRPALRAIIEAGALLIVPRGSWRLAALQLFFTGGTRRSFLIAHQTAAYRRPGKLAARSVVGGTADIDIRKPADAVALEKELLRLDLSAI